jgi:hypothetical protein
VVGEQRDSRSHLVTNARQLGALGYVEVGLAAAGAVVVPAHRELHRDGVRAPAEARARVRVRHGRDPFPLRSYIRCVRRLRDVAHGRVLNCLRRDRGRGGGVGGGGVGCGLTAVRSLALAGARVGRLARQLRGSEGLVGLGCVVWCGVVWCGGLDSVGWGSRSGSLPASDPAARPLPRSRRRWERECARVVLRIGPRDLPFRPDPWLSSREADMWGSAGSVPPPR